MPLVYMRKHLRDTKTISILKSRPELSEVLLPGVHRDSSLRDHCESSEWLSSLRIGGVLYTTAAVKNRKGISRNSRILFLDFDGSRVAGQIQSIQNKIVPIITVKRFQRHCNDVDPFRLATHGYMWTVIDRLEREEVHIPATNVLNHVGYLPTASLVDFSTNLPCAVIIDLSHYAGWLTSSYN